MIASAIFRFAHQKLTVGPGSRLSNCNLRSTLKPYPLSPSSHRPQPVKASKMSEWRSEEQQVKMAIDALAGAETESVRTHEQGLFSILCTFRRILRKRPNCCRRRKCGACMAPTSCDRPRPPSRPIPLPSGRAESPPPYAPSSALLSLFREPR